MSKPIDGDQALNIAVAAIQKSLGVKTGDFAGVYFSGNDNWYLLVEMLDEYIKAEIAFRED
jgi:hypothetical protein